MQHPIPYSHGRTGRCEFSEQDLDRFWSKVEVSDGCWLWRGTMGNKGYGQFYTDKKRRLAHRVSYEINVDMIPADHEVCHRCDNPRCVNPAHLFVGTHAENMADRNGKGRSRGPKGMRHGRANLTDEQVKAIRGRFTDGRCCKDLAQEFGVGPSAVYKIVHRETWRHVN